MKRLCILILTAITLIFMNEKGNGQSLQRADVNLNETSNLENIYPCAPM